MMSPTVYTVTPGDKTAFPTCAEQHSQKGECDGMIKARKRTDILFFKLIVCMWIAMSAVGGIAVQRGDTNRLIVPLDDNGSLCGISADVKGKYRFYTVTAAGSDDLWLSSSVGKYSFPLC